ncbi:MAG TPA: tetratricopeptide repeat protein [Methylomirabilota bacterium]|jgi:predicted Zn-dependent protease
MRGDASRVARGSLVWLGIVGVFGCSCASPATAPSPVAEQPSRVDQEEQQLEQKVKAYEGDPVFGRYLARLVQTLTPDAADGPSLTVLVLSDPTLNAFSMPNGRIYVHTGLLACLDNEAQLAMILGHEMTHVANRDAVRFVRDAASPPALLTAPTVGAGDAVDAAVLSPTAVLLLSGKLPLAATAAITGYGRDAEGDADAGGMAGLIRAGYDVREAPKVYERLARATKARGGIEMFALGNPRFLAERVEDTDRLLQTRYASVAPAPRITPATAEFGLRMRPVARENARLDIQAGRFALAAAQLDRVLTLAPRDAIAHLYYGDLYRLRSQRSHDAAERAEQEHEALEAYEGAAALDPSYADPFRQLGLLYVQRKDPARARAAFEKYLALKPDAADSQRIKAYLAELGRRD